MSGIGDVDVVAGAFSTASDLAVALAPHPGPPASRSVRVERSGVVLDPAQLLARLDLRSGDRIEIVDVGPETALDRGPDPLRQPSAVMRMLTGPLAGNEYELAAGVTTIGRAAGNDLSLADPGVSRHHAVVSVDAASVVVADRGSTNGIRIEGRLIDGPTALRASERLLLGQSWVTIDHHGVPVTPVEGRVVFDRPQRRARIYRGRVFEVVPPPIDESARPARRGTLVGRLQRNQPEPADDGALDAVVADLNLARRQEREARVLEYPSIDDVMLAVRSQTRLWERRLTDPDALRVRLGLAELPSRHQIDVTPGGSESFRRRAERLPHTYGVIDGVPATYDLGRAGGLTVRGEPGRCQAVANALVGQLVGLNPPDQLGVVLCGDGLDGWDWLKWLPHARPAGGTGPSAGPTAVELIESLLDAGPDLQDVGAARPPFILVVVDRSATGDAATGAGRTDRATGSDERLDALVDRLLTEGSQRGLHPLVIDSFTDAGTGRPSTTSGAVLTITGPTAHLSVPDAAGGALDAIAVEELRSPVAVELARLLAPLVVGPAIDLANAAPPDGTVAAPVPGGDAAVTVRPLQLVTPPPPDDGPVDLFDLPRSKGDSRLVLGRVVVGDGTETVLAFNPPRDGTLALVGPPGSERAGCLQTVAASAARLGVAAEERPLVYAFGDGDALDGLRNLPTTAGLAGDAPAEAIALLAEIEQRMDDRLLTFELAGVEDLTGFREARPGVTLRRILVLIDGLGRLTSLVEPDRPGRTREVVGQLLEIGSGLGLHLVFTVEDRDVVDPLLDPKVGRWLEIDTSVDRPGRVRLDGAAVRFAVPGGSWEPDDIAGALSELGASVAAELDAAGHPVPNGGRRAVDDTAEGEAPTDDPDGDPADDERRNGDGATGESEDGDDGEASHRAEETEDTDDAEETDDDHTPASVEVGSPEGD